MGLQNGTSLGIKSISDSGINLMMWSGSDVQIISILICCGALIQLLFWFGEQPKKLENS